jgi:hypothetical protein
MDEGGTEIRYASTEPAYPCAFFSDHEDSHLVRFADGRGSALHCRMVPARCAGPQTFLCRSAGEAAIDG